ncbi:copper resistance protein NlpE N-terminal domain-containing protein [Larkinella humicola]|uniref:NlpE-like protein n=1 Tax=Larkinella humicola TaxID=2607654 RepID=A0A5N1JD66_9BACT|nr:copper resistance protein NlpE N-terminal domain-containing protein [Larkinella humicola]KAA9347083.1 hypothetical protein F0P93_26080 [Larkinella humicola]
MKTRLHLKLLKKSILIVLAAGFMQATSPEPAVYFATTPCDGIPRMWLSIPATADCEMIQWNLALQRDPRNQAPTFYKLSYAYGISKPSTQTLMNNGTRGVKEGQWSLVKDRKNRDLYRLTPTAPDAPISLVKLDDRLLHLLDQEGNLMIGHAGWSYTLNRK